MAKLNKVKTGDNLVCPSFAIPPPPLYFVLGWISLLPSGCVILALNQQKQYFLLINLIGKEMVDYIADYLENIRDRRVFPDVKPGYMREMLPENPPNDGEAWERIFKDVEGVIMPGVIDFPAYTVQICIFFRADFFSLFSRLFNVVIRIIFFEAAKEDLFRNLFNYFSHYFIKVLGNLPTIHSLWNLDIQIPVHLL